MIGEDITGDRIELPGGHIRSGSVGDGGQGACDDQTGLTHDSQLIGGLDLDRTAAAEHRLGLQGQRNHDASGDVLDDAEAVHLDQQAL